MKLGLEAVCAFDLIFCQNFWAKKLTSFDLLLRGVWELTVDFDKLDDDPN